MALIGMHDVSIAFGGPPVLDQARFAIERGERVCLLGRNGAGKSTIMKLLHGELAPDAGEVVRQSGVTVARLDQEVPDDIEGSTYDVVAEGLGPAGALLARYHHASHRVATEHSDAALREMDRLHHELDVAGAWEMQTRVDTVLQHLALDADAPFHLLSGGRKRQVLLARALVRQPDVLLLDEPTNHLDVDAIEWMERFLIDRDATIIFVTHDRAFLRRLATRIVELDRGRLVDWGGNYDAYLRRKEAALAAEAKEWAEFDKKLAKEEVWIRTGIQARRTRNEGRVRSLEALRLERRARRDRVGTVKLQAQEAERSGKLVVEAKAVGFSRGDRPIVKDLTTTIMRGDRVGLIGPNGSGKTTLLRLLLGELPPDSGTVRIGTGLEVAYFDQLREQLDPERSVFDSVADGADFIEVRGETRKHVSGYLQDFLFSPDRARTPVRALSGGERNRLLLARLFTRRFNLLVLDEPTNDLDIETLDLLEELLLEFSGTLLLVSHDRAFLDAVVTSTLVFGGGGRVSEYAGGYTDWVRQRPAPAVTPPPTSRKTAPVPVPRPSRQKKLSFRETAELAELPDRIDALEREREQLYLSLADPALLRDGSAVATARARLETLDAEITGLTGRWEALETIAAGGGG
ncbi:MAG: ATP-binding cassette domain-containing protein [Gemmatimonadaceae bacterium]|nr:ATP-binding cassette domain-containing protein [Gemmatimonadaceae bacterium]NUP72597.1 ATP-binding cassette domain-containing protein [Gemmatimonadaceae bacterium]NUS33576.1 ATP-binding cassette domain-containing protein [Gemmatimonadaceae bacterium]